MQSVRGLITRTFIVVSVLLSVSTVGHTNDLGEHTVNSLCVTCHRIEGAPIARKDKQAPDLIWAGNKYQSSWLEAWLQDPTQRLYPLGYDYNVKRKKPHLAISSAQAAAVTTYLATLKDPRIQEGTMKPGTPAQIQHGARLYQEHACVNCHWTPARNRRGYTGGKSSTSLLAMGTRLKGDWVYRFNLNPDDFVPDSGAYIPDPPISKEDVYAITSYMMTFK